MKCVVWIAAVFSLAAADAASARTPVHRATYRKPAASAHLRHMAPARAHKIKAAEKVPLRPAPKPPPEPPDGAPDRLGLFKAEDRGGLGVSNGRSEAMVGLFTRPLVQDLGPDIYHAEGRGAAGVAFHITLGKKSPRQ
jgi:hypothetical protein